MASYTEDVRNEKGEPYEYTAKEKKFIAAYLNDPKHNATNAAASAGYKSDVPGTIRAQASRMMARPHIRAAINQAFESLAMPKMEIIHRLARIAAGSIADVMNDDNELDLDLARDNGTDWLIRKIERRRDIVEVKTEDLDTPDGEVRLERSIVRETVKFEIHDPLRALELLGKSSRLFIERVEATGKGGAALIPDGPKVVFYLPDNGRGDADGETAAERSANDDRDALDGVIRRQPTTKQTTRQSEPE